MLKLPKLLFFGASHWWLLLLLDKNIRYYQRCIKQTPPRQFSILINDSDLREFDLHATLCYLTKIKDSKLIFRYFCNNFRIFLSHYASLKKQCRIRLVFVLVGRYGRLKKYITFFASIFYVKTKQNCLQIRGNINLSKRNKLLFFKPSAPTITKPSIF